jgi:hypothetical protein
MALIGPANSPAQAPAKGRADDGPKVTSRAAADLLKPPNSDPYGPGEIDWRDVPPWRQTSFFGIRAQGQLFIYVVDCSGSMIDEDRLFRAKSELRRSVGRLQSPQRFKVIFYNDRPVPMPGDLPRPADLRSKGLLSQWLRLIEPDGKTDPRGAMALALALRPDAVFLLSDGEFPEGTVEDIARRNRRKVPIHCIDLTGGESGDQLRQIARDNGGQYAGRPWTGGPSP